MMRRRSVEILVAAIALFASAPPVMAAVLTLNDGRVHNIRTTAYEAVAVDYRKPGMGTTVNVLDGSVINTFIAREDSTTNMVGGWIRYLYGNDRSQVNVSDGTIGDEIEARDSSKVNFSGGVINNEIHAEDSSHVTVSGGSMVRLHAEDSSQVAVSGGAIEEFLSAKGSSQVTVSGGTISAIWASFSSQVTVSGGSITDLGAWKRSQIVVSGGHIGGQFRLEDNAVLTVEGSDFAIDGTPVGYIELSSILGGSPVYEPYRRLTGTLLSGDPLDNDFRIGYSGKIVLVPEPATLLLLGLGGLMLRKRRREVF